MQDFPHRYRATAVARGELVDVSSPGLQGIETAGPAEFDGPGDRWSPETMLTGAIANCFILTFRSVARASKFEWVNILCEVEASLDRVNRKNLFTQATLNVKLAINDPAKRDQAERVLRKSEENCLITNSLTAKVNLLTNIEVAKQAAVG